MNEKIKVDIKRLTMEEKTEAMIQTIYRISNSSFTGVQRPPGHILRTQIENGDVYIARWPSVGLVIGFAIVVERNGAPYVWSIAVDSNYRGLTVGTQLLEEIRLTEMFRHRDFIELAVQPSNPAQKLYFDAGYRVRAVARGFYGEEGDGLLMRRDL